MNTKLIDFFVILSEIPRKHKRVLGCRQYLDYTSKKLEEALQTVIEGRFGITFGTFYN